MVTKNNRWSPKSKVNCNHLAGMLAKGSDEYKSWVSRIFGADGDGFADLVEEGQAAGYLTDGNVDTLLGTSNSPAVKEAAAQGAKRTMVLGLLAADQDEAIKSLITTGQLDQEFVDGILAEYMESKTA